MRLNTHARGFELLMLAPAPVSLPNVRPQSGLSRAVSRNSRHRDVETKKDIDSSTSSNAITPPIDWNAEISRAGRVASGLDPQNPIKDFGFPKTPPSMADYPQFDWDYARTHRVESIPEGGVVIHLNDNCMLVLNPLPMAFCWPFKRAANGELFKHMRDPDNSGDERVP